MAPWGGQLRQGPDAGDGAGTADGAAEFTAFATAVGGTWLRGDRARVRSAGPVPSSRFA
ncbi:hypothetical protein [Streptomyces echinatus]|uniref:Uncharacterized protein n=1 Tax=Streptomyces echinatus TaxID=67293 RepID=A0A7W9Q2H4_9ACTN|nr:hypothetical protein [Streptomyces echinatus]MBB5931522.1 hypothetical protein [Streptomyces echinatus]